MNYKLTRKLNNSLVRSSSKNVFGVDGETRCGPELRLGVFSGDSQRENEEAVLRAPTLRLAVLLVNESFERGGVPWLIATSEIA